MEHFTKLMREGYLSEINHALVCLIKHRSRTYLECLLTSNYLLTAFTPYSNCCINCIDIKAPKSHLRSHNFYTPLTVTCALAEDSLIKQILNASQVTFCMSKEISWVFSKN